MSSHVTHLSLWSLSWRQDLAFSYFLWPDNHKHVVGFRNITLISKYISTWQSSPCLLLFVFMWHQAYQIKVHICLCLANANNILFYRNGCCQATFLCRHFSAHNIFSLLLDNCLFRKIPDVWIREGSSDNPMWYTSLLLEAILLILKLGVYCRNAFLAFLIFFMYYVFLLIIVQARISNTMFFWSSSRKHPHLVPI